MGVGFRKDMPELKRAFNAFLSRLQLSGEYQELVRKYYPDVFDYYPDFFRK
jgi:ABC-type amino acid transport substrate-binding protein